MGERLRVAGRHLLPPVLWTLVIFALSTNAFSGSATGSALERVLRACCPALLERLSPAQLDVLNVAVRKLAHLTEYAVVGALWSRALGRLPGASERVAIGGALGAAAFTAVADEVHQAFSTARMGAPTDVLLDCCGAVAGTIAYRLWIRSRVKCPISASRN